MIVPKLIAVVILVVAIVACVNAHFASHGELFWAITAIVTSLAGLSAAEWVKSKG